MEPPSVSSPSDLDWGRQHSPSSLPLALSSSLLPATCHWSLPSPPYCWTYASSLPARKQSHIIIACMALHNFIRKADINDEYFITYVEDVSDEDPSEDGSLMGDDTDMCLP